MKSEIVPLEWSQVDRTAKVIRLEVGTTKNREGRTLPYGSLPELTTVIDDAWKLHEGLAAGRTICPLVFPKADGESWRDNFYDAWDAATKAARCPGRIPHDLRRTAVKNLVRRGVSEKIAMSVSGHKTRSVFDRYDIVNEQDIADAMGKLSGQPAAAGKRRGQVRAFGRRK